MSQLRYSKEKEQKKQDLSKNLKDWYLKFIAKSGKVVDKTAAFKGLTYEEYLLFQHEEIK